MIKFGVGQPVTRLEDARLLKGKGRYQDDANMAGTSVQCFCGRRTRTPKSGRS
jgi:carbon-monoxide dehydrogenase large subunit